MTTPLRRWAMKISCVVVRLAPEGAKDWAQATAREMEFIESDWAALRWALGSVRILLRPAEPRLVSLAEVPQASLRFAKEIHKRTVTGVITCALEIVYFASLLYRNRMRAPMHRMGFYLLIGGMLYMTLQLLARRSGLPSRQDSPVSPAAYRLELERQRDFHAGGWLWSRVILLVPGPLLLLSNMGQAFSHTAYSPGSAAETALLDALLILVVFFALLVLAIPLNKFVARKYQRRIDDLDSIETGKI